MFTPVKGKRFKEKQRTSKTFSAIKERPPTKKEKQLLRGRTQKNSLKLNCTRVLFYIIMFVDILHDYLFKIRGRGNIIQRIYSFYETLQIILKGISNETEKNEFIEYIKLITIYLHEMIPKEELNKIFYKYNNVFYRIYNFDKNEFNSPEIKKYKSDARELFKNTGKVRQENMVLRNGTVIPRSNYIDYKINLEKFDKLFETNGYHGIDFKDFLKVLIGINTLTYEGIKYLFSKFNFDIVLEKKNTVNFENLLTNDPFNIPLDVYNGKKKLFLETGRGIYLSQFLDAQNHYPISLLYKFKNENINGDFTFNNLIENFSFTLKDKNYREVLSINAEELILNYGFKTGIIKVNYSILDIVNSYLVEKNNNGSASTISTGYRYTDLFPKFLGDFLQIIQAVNLGLNYGSRDKISFLTLFLFDNIHTYGIYELYNKKTNPVSYLCMKSRFIRKRKPLLGGKKKKSNYKYKKMAKGKKKTKKTMKGGQDILTPHNTTTGWHLASQPAPTVGSISGNMENYTFSLPTVQDGGSQKVYVKGVGYRKLRFTKTGNRYVIVHGKRKRI